MKIFKVILVSFLVLVVVLIAALIVFVKTFDINRFKPQIVSQASSALNRRVDFEKAGLALSFREGVSLKVSNLVIADDPAFAPGDFFKADTISLSIDVLGYLFHKKISISNALVDGFRVMIIRHKDGSMNVQTIAQPTAGKGIAQEQGKVAAPMALPALLVSTFKASNGEVAYVDHATEPPVNLVVSEVNFTVSNISLTDKFPFTLEGRVLSGSKNIHIEGKAHVNLTTNEVAVSDLKGVTNLSLIILKQIPVSFPMVQGAALPLSLSGTAQVNVGSLTAGPKGMTALKGNIELKDGVLQLAQMALPLKAVALRATLTQANIILDTLSASLGEGSIKGTGSIDEYLTKQGFTAVLDANNLHVEDLIAQGILPVKAKGIASGHMQVKGQGFTPEALTASLTGTGTIALTKVVFEDINVFQRVMSKLSMIPGRTEKIETAVPERYKQRLAQKDTSFSDLELPVTIENGRVLIKDTTISAEMFSLKSSAKVGFDGSYSMEGSFLIPADLSAAMIIKVPELQYILNEDKQIFIPLKVSGKAAGAALSVDAGYIAQKLITSQAKTQLIQAIDKTIGPKGQSTEQSSNSPAQDTGVKAQSGSEDLGRSILGNILKK